MGSLHAMRKLTTVLLIILTLFAISACGGGQQEPQTSTPGTSGEQNNQSASDELKKVTIAEPVRTMSFAPVYAAISKGYFEEEGIEVNLVSGGAGPQVTAALLSGDALFGTSQSAEIFKLISQKKQDVQVILNMNYGLSFQIAVSKQYAESKGVKPDAPLNERIAALKGARIGVGSLQGAEDMYLRFTLMTAGLNAEDANPIKIGVGGAKIAAMQQGAIDGLINGPPVAGQVVSSGLGYIWVDPGEVPEYENMVGMVLYGLKDKVEQNPELAGKVARAVAKGLNFVYENPEEAAKALEPFFKGMDSQVIAGGLNDVLYIYKGDGRMTKEGWDKAAAPVIELPDLSGVSEPIDTSEGTFWTNKYLD